MKNKFCMLFIALFFSLAGIAQEVAAPVEMADTFRSEGKIYVVIAVLSIIFICLTGYLIRLDLKLKKLENKN